MTSVHPTAMSPMGLGLGWNIAFAAAEVAGLTSPAEPGRLPGADDLVSRLGRFPPLDQ